VAFSELVNVSVVTRYVSFATIGPKGKGAVLRDRLTATKLSLRLTP
jgi:hypothetical protein